jgi:hypothetical protein
MDPFKPYGNLRGFIYSISDNAVYIDASMTVFLPVGTTLSSRNAEYDPATHAAIKKYDHARAAQIAPYYFVDNFRIEIIPNVAVPYTPNDHSGFKQALAATFASSYSVTFIVNTVNNDPDTGGSSTNTLTSGSTISIL